MFLQFIYQMRREHFPKSSEYLSVNLFKKKKKACRGNVNKDHEPLPCFPFQNFTQFCTSQFSLLRAHYNIWLTAAALHKTVVLASLGGFTERSQSSEAEPCSWGSLSLALLGDHRNGDVGSKVECYERAFEDADGLNTLSHNLLSLIELNPTAVAGKMDIFVKFV